MRVVGLDVGDKRIGVAISDELGMTAQPLTRIKRSSLEKDIEKILNIVKEYAAQRIVAGVPYNMDGTIGPAADKVLRFVSSLREKSRVEVEERDERFSTVAVERVLLQGDVSRRKRRDVVDKLAAAYILQGYLDSKKGLI